MNTFVNRTTELKKLVACQKRTSGLIVIFGRRRVGKTRLITKWLESSGVSQTAYSQAVEGGQELQIEQIAGDLSETLDLVVHPRTWGDFFSILRKLPPPWIICLDEFQYLVQTSPSLPSMLQKFIDHHLPKKCHLVISGSSQSLMRRLVTDSTEPLYERSVLTLNIRPMDYPHFSKYMNLYPESIGTFQSFSLVGGLPRYWKTLEQLDLSDAVTIADRLYFDTGSPLEDEADRILKDEGSVGQMARSLLECIGRGSHKMSEIAGRIQQPATNLSRPLKLLVDLGIVTKDVPFGVSERDSKKSLYRLNDPVLEFWYSTYSPLRVRWQRLSIKEKKQAISLHASRILERSIRDSVPGAQRYWESNLEWDSVHVDTGSSIIIREIKASRLSTKEKGALKQEIHNQFKASALRGTFQLKRVEILDIDDCLTILSRPNQTNLV